MIRWEVVMRLAAIALGLMMVAGPGWAGPDATTNRFLNDTVSMMDWGLLRTESFMEKRGKADITARYDWDSNRIMIEDMQIRNALPDDVEAECKDWFALPLSFPPTRVNYTAQPKSVL
ncbi:hypothetical protein DIE28_09970 [Paracoccus thiocyanatus]|uniref:Uncharacterized protein n=1 Tax=Paracoccus thiocyanatus TaxID=34006 RepID=A0A3D8PBU6_9RHOB|nr:hypothetical protein DIE28_09970 [Paracoccus thiocyanatus]